MINTIPILKLANSEYKDDLLALAELFNEYERDVVQPYCRQENMHPSQFGGQHPHNVWLQDWKAELAAARTRILDKLNALTVKQDEIIARYSREQWWDMASPSHVNHSEWAFVTQNVAVDTLRGIDAVADAMRYATFDSEIERPRSEGYRYIQGKPTMGRGRHYDGTREGSDRDW